MNKLKTGFSRVRDVDLADRTRAVIAALSDNSNFPGTARALATLKSRLAPFESALALPKGTAREEQLASTRSPLATQLEQLARKLEITPGVTDDALAMTGFEIRQRSVRTDAPVDAPDNVRLKGTGKMGSVQLLCDAVKRAKTYQVQYALDPNSGPWIDAGIFGSTRRIILSGLTRGKDYWFRVRAIGPRGPGAWSDRATIMVT